MPGYVVYTAFCVVPRASYLPVCARGPARVLVHASPDEILQRNVGLVNCQL